MNCMVCGAELKLDVCRGKKEREAIMLTCCVDGRHFRAFINEPKVAEGVSKHSLNLEESIERWKQCDR
ncbi:hypothetical protein ACFLWZ_03325 [Chloroflexota bacterium]